jgi:hypothetical protein
MKEGSVDLNEIVMEATAAARKGDLEALESELIKIRALGDTIVGFDSRLRAMARSAREHPSFREVPKLKAV